MLAVNDTATAVPALIRVQNDRRTALVGIGNIHIHLTHIHTGIASYAELRIENHRCVRGRNVRQGTYIYLSHRGLPIFLYKLQCNPCYEPRNSLSCRPNSAEAIRRI